MEMRDQAIIEAILIGGRQRQEGIKEIYQQNNLREKVIHYVMQNKGKREDGQDVFHEGIILLDRNIRERKFRGDSSLSLYLYGICRLIWMNQLRKHQKVDLQENNEKMDGIQEHTPESNFISQEKRSILQSLLSRLGDKCKKVLELWQLSYSMEEIAQKVGLSSEKMARKSKYRCQKSLMELIKKEPEWRERLL